MSQPSAPAAFAATLQAELAALAELNRILELEQECLLGTDTDTLLALSERKSRTVEQLAALAERRAALLRSAGLPPGRAGVQQWLAAQPDFQARPLREAWSKLLDAAADARVANQINGGLIGTRLGHNQAALGALQGAASHHSVYRPDGQSDLRVANRELGRA
jgi:flagella synthesis protein FlgN